MEMTKPRLGRGLASLLGDMGEESSQVDGKMNSCEIAVSSIQLNPYQPRKSFDDDEISQLSESIRLHGILQPLVVRKTGEDFQLIAGERRLRAARKIGLNEVPVHIVNFNDQQVLEVALVENIQRSDLNPIEKALGFKDYMQRYKVTKEQLAQKLSMDRTTVTNLVNLLLLPSEVQDALRLDQITMGHAKVLRSINNPEKQIALSKEVMLKGLSVKALEALVKGIKLAEMAPEQNQSFSELPSVQGSPVNQAGDTHNQEMVPSSHEADASIPDAQPATPEANADKSLHITSLENEIRQRLATRFEIRPKGKDRGQFIIHFESNDDFERIVEILRR